MNEHLKTLSASPIFKDIDSSYLSSLLHTCQILTIQTGEVVFQQGEQSNDMYVILQGGIDISITITGSDRTESLTFLNQGATFGEMGLVTNLQRSATATAKTDSTLLIISKSFIDASLQKNDPYAAQVIYNIAGLLSQRLKTTSEMILNTKANKDGAQSEIAQFRERLLQEVLI